MGLAQVLITENGDSQKLEEFIDSLSNVVSLKKTETSWIISEFENQKFKFEIKLITDGYYTHRSGNYFAFLGFFIEALTANFGRVSVEDV